MARNAILKEGAAVVKKRIAVSPKRQITIPIDFYKMVGINNEVECYVQNGTIVICPVQENPGGEFAEQILADLISQGYSGEELLSKFKETNRQMRSAVECLLNEAGQVASGQSSYVTYADVFEEEDK